MNSEDRLEVLSLTPDERKGHYEVDPSLKLYQLEFTKIYSGKFVKSTKRRITWFFGFADNKLLEDGKKGVECRGKEYSVHMVWSILSGKQEIRVNGQYVYSAVSDANNFNYSWSMYGENKIDFRVEAVGYLGEDEGERGDQNKYKLFVNEKLFHTFPNAFNVGHEIYQQNIESSRSLIEGPVENPFDQYASAPTESVNAPVRHAPPADLLSFGSFNDTPELSSSNQRQMVRVNSIGSFGSAPDASRNEIFESFGTGCENSNWENGGSHPLQRVLSLDGDLGAISTGYQAPSQNQEFWFNTPQNTNSGTGSNLLPNSSIQTGNIQPIANFQPDKNIPNFDFGTGLGLSQPETNKDSSELMKSSVNSNPCTSNNVGFDLLSLDQSPEIKSMENSSNNPGLHTSPFEKKDAPLIDFSM